MICKLQVLFMLMFFMRGYFQNLFCKCLLVFWSLHDFRHGRTELRSFDLLLSVDSFLSNPLVVPTTWRTPRLLTCSFFVVWRVGSGAWRKWMCFAWHIYCVMGGMTWSEMELVISCIFEEPESCTHNVSVSDGGNQYCCSQSSRSVCDVRLRTVCYIL